ncbi:hypothetical protein L6452_38576 [Arctium lappa]|uniref:Uncharacterized protein n=1 Tax=Arctium lappa TaxID=4217 RepID=A0ACB8XPJ7_ARCLA|nr:hypothetical protein L6452_38576 [Arctium lappa]
MIADEVKESDSDDKEDEDINAFAQSIALITHQFNKRFGKKVLEKRREEKKEIAEETEDGSRRKNIIQSQAQLSTVIIGHSVQLSRACTALPINQNEGRCFRRGKLGHFSANCKGRLIEDQDYYKNKYKYNVKERVLVAEIEDWLSDSTSDGETDPSNLYGMEVADDDQSDGSSQDNSEKMDTLSLGFNEMDPFTGKKKTSLSSTFCIGKIQKPDFPSLENSNKSCAKKIIKISKSRDSGKTSEAVTSDRIKRDFLDFDFDFDSEVDEQIFCTLEKVIHKNKHTVGSGILIKPVPISKEKPRVPICPNFLDMCLKAKTSLEWEREMKEKAKVNKKEKETFWAHGKNNHQNKANFNSMKYELDRNACKIPSARPETQPLKHQKIQSGKTSKDEKPNIEKKATKPNKNGPIMRWHMTGDKKLLSSFKEKLGGVVTFRDNKQGQIRGYGELSRGKVSVSKVAYVDGLKHNLLNISQLCDHGFDVKFQEKYCSLLHSNTVQKMLRADRKVLDCSRQELARSVVRASQELANSRTHRNIDWVCKVKNSQVVVKAKFKPR